MDNFMAQYLYKEIEILPHGNLEVSYRFTSTTICQTFLGPCYILNTK